ncbi:MAG: beta-lactamase family protein [Gemmatimonadetes bacterium]|nr:beta-lactamase family protein [Gemmatimonadota bacterium]
MRRATVLAALALCTSTPDLPAQDISTHPRVREAIAMLEAWMDGQRGYEQIPGVSGAVVYDQAVLWKGGYGFADVARRAPATASTIYSICSISKLFTSIGVMQQRDATRLRLDDPVSKHLPWYRVKSSNPESGEVTVAGILTHSSGLPRESDHAYWSAPDFAFPTRQQVIDGLSKQETLYPADTYFQYSNLGLTLAGEIVAATSGMPYADYVRQRIINPLGLMSTTPEMPAGERGKRLATGYSAIPRDGGRTPLPFFEVRGIAPAAGYASTVEDLATFAAWQFRALRNPKDPILGANTLREMQRVHWTDPDFTTTYGLGFSVWRSDNKTFTGHGGSCPGFQTQLLLRPEEQVATVFMSNANGVNASQFAQRMFDIVSPAIRAAVRDSGRTRPADATIDPYLGRYESSFGGESVALRWEGGLALMRLPSTDPVRSLTRLRKVGEHTFRRIRADETLGEAFTFVMGPNGRPSHYTVHNNRYPRVP